MEDLQIGDSIRSKIASDPQLKKELIEINVQGQVVTLSGAVSNKGLSVRAEEVVANIEGIKSVKNHLVITSPDENISDDEKIKNRLINTFSMNNQIALPNLNIDVKNRVVTISGSVDEIWKKILIREMAIDTSGIKKVINKVAVTPPTKEKDDVLAKKIQNTIDKNYMVDVNRVHISVKRGTVKLSGEVMNQLALRAALNSAIYTPGVTGIDNELTISMN